ncbi:MAG: hypothetical protein U0794_06750 [Isosphaeraceae bacterium]
MFDSFGQAFPLVVVVALAAWLAMISGGVYLISRVFFQATCGGWSSLVERFSTEEPPMGASLYHHESVKVGHVIAKRCALGVGPRGLYLRCPWHHAVLIPGPPSRRPSPPRSTGAAPPGW